VFKLYYQVENQGWFPLGTYQTFEAAKNTAATIDKKYPDTQGAPMKITELRKVNETIIQGKEG
jgi:hypothetical protein